MNTPAQLVERFLAEMLGWEEHMHRIDDALADVATDIDADRLEALEFEMHREAELMLRRIFAQYLHPKALSSARVERCASLDYADPPDFHNPHILETRQSSDGHEVTVKLNDAFGSLVKISVCPDENGLLKLRNIQLNEGGKWKAHSF